MRPYKLLWNVGVKAPAKAAKFLWKLEKRGWLREKVALEVSKAHDLAGPMTDVPPPPLPTSRPGFQVIDVGGTALSWVDDAEFFPNALNSIPTGPVLVTGAVRPNAEGRKGMAAFVNGRQVGWLSEHRRDALGTARDWPWLQQLDKGGIYPRFRALHHVDGDEHLIYFLVPKFSSADATPSPKKLRKRLNETNPPKYEIGGSGP